MGLLHQMFQLKILRCNSPTCREIKTLLMELQKELGPDNPCYKDISSSSTQEKLSREEYKVFLEEHRKTLISSSE